MVLGFTDRNFVGLEHLLPGLAPQWTTEDDVITNLLEDRALRTALVEYLEEHAMEGVRVFHIHHLRLFIPLWYNLGEGEEQFAFRLRDRQRTGEVLGLVCGAIIAQLSHSRPTI